MKTKLPGEQGLRRRFVERERERDWNGQLELSKREREKERENMNRGLKGDLVYLL